MKIYTRTGDEGDTGLFGGPRVPKDHPRIEAYGTVDELNASLGMARSIGGEEALDECLQRIQSELFDLGAELATPNPSTHGTATISDAQITWMEQRIDEFELPLEPLRQFILPGGTALASSLHLSRTICRRAERGLIRFGREVPNTIRGELIRYLNRLGDLLFVMARFANHRAGRRDEAWRGIKNKAEGGES